MITSPARIERQELQTTISDEGPQVAVQGCKARYRSRCADERCPSRDVQSRKIAGVPCKRSWLRMIPPAPYRRSAEKSRPTAYCSTVR
jgi:hypothetical protein